MFCVHLRQKGIPPAFSRDSCPRLKIFIGHRMCIFCIAYDANLTQVLSLRDCPRTKNRGGSCGSAFGTGGCTAVQPGNRRPAGKTPGIGDTTGASGFAENEKRVLILCEWGPFEKTYPVRYAFGSCVSQLALTVRKVALISLSVAAGFIFFSASHTKSAVSLSTRTLSPGAKYLAMLSPKGIFFSAPGACKPPDVAW